tara:strand:+ start:1953 stop:2159 length:207 start_codon:yes stop_codon:yes gene_type:complete
MNKRVEASTALAESDTVIVRIAEAVSLGLISYNAKDVQAWATYRRSLRDIVATGEGDIPAKPDYPAGT